MNLVVSFLQNRFLCMVFIAMRTGLSNAMATSGVAMPGTLKRSRAK